MIVRSHGHVTFVGPFEQREDWTGGRDLRDFDEFLKPHHYGYAALVARLDPQRDVPALVMGPVVTDRLAAGADAGNRHPHSQARHRGCSLHEIREVGMKLGPAAVETLPQFVEDDRDRVRAEFSGAVVQDLDEPAEVCTLDIRAQVYGHADLGDGVLPAVLPVPYGDGVADPADADLADGQLPVIEAVLDIFEHQAASPR